MRNDPKKGEIAVKKVRGQRSARKPKSIVGGGKEASSEDG